MKHCWDCDTDKDKKDFYPKGGRCKVCANVASKQNMRDNPERTRAIRKKSKLKNKEVDTAGKRRDYQKNKLVYRNYYLIREFGISIETYNEMFEEQLGCCSICGKHQINFQRRLSVDHNHITGRVRGLLCGDCNLSLGTYENRKEEFEHYLKEFN